VLLATINPQTTSVGCAIVQAEYSITQEMNYQYLGNMRSKVGNAHTDEDEPEAIVWALRCDDFRPRGKDSDVS
jgi:hypothetical protein